jgi:hypothetical protein
MRLRVGHADHVRIERHAVSNSSIYQIRRIERISVETPLLIPSFSSRGFPDLSRIIDALRVDVSEMCLVSAFDLANGYVPPDFETIADIVIVDSGMYETSPLAVAVDAYLPASSKREWNREAYRSLLNEMSTRMSLTNTIVVSFDSYLPFDEQVERAQDDFNCAPGAAQDFLIKPEVTGSFHGGMVLTSGQIANFDVIGVTERELGRSPLERCQALLRLRSLLSAEGVATPIHVFGSITPAAVTAYFLCGADIFDGLNWLRVGLDEKWASAPSEFAVAHRLWAEEDNITLLEFWKRNLRVLQRTQGALKRFVEDGNRIALCATLPFADTCLALADMAMAARKEAK